MRSLRGKPPLVITDRESIRCGTRGRRSPALSAQAAALRRRPPRFYDRDLRRLFSDAPEYEENMTAAQFLSRIRRPVRRLVASWTGIYQYTIDQVFEDMIARCRELKLRLAVPDEQARRSSRCCSPCRR